MRVGGAEEQMWLIRALKSGFCVVCRCNFFFLLLGVHASYKDGITGLKFIRIHFPRILALFVTSVRIFMKLYRVTML